MSGLSFDITHLDGFAILPGGDIRHTGCGEIVDDVGQEDNDDNVGSLLIRCVGHLAACAGGEPS